MISPPRGLNRANFTRWYREVYLRSDHWIAVRDDALERWSQCQRCGSPRRLQVHHLSYERLGCEPPEDLLVVCRRCHDQIETARIERRLESRRARIGEDEDDLFEELSRTEVANVPDEEEDVPGWWRQQVAEWPDNTD
jgi:hypothetical protein